MNLIAGEGTLSTQCARLHKIVVSPILATTPVDPEDLHVFSTSDLLEICKLSNDHIIDEEKALCSFICCYLMT